MLPSSGFAHSPRDGKKEADRRKLAKAKFLYFCKYTDPKFEDAAHMRLIADKLEQVAKFIQSGGKEGIGRLMILLPPRHGKSEMASRKFPAWLLGRIPDARIIMASYGADLASKNSRAVRDLITSRRYQNLFGGYSSANEPVELSSDSRSVASWDLANPHRGGVVAAGVGGGITGLGADLLIGDDLIKNRDEAESETRRETVDDWWKSSAHTRLEKESSAIILFFTHWHPDDQVGRLMKRMVENDEADQWDILMMPALALGSYPADEAEQRQKMREGVYLPLADPLGRKEGEPLWPTRFSREWLLGKRANLGTYEFEALYQQMPFLREGGMFKREYFPVWDTAPGKEVLARVRCWDKASTEGGGARTSGVKMSKGKDGFYYVEHVVKGQWSTYQRDSKIVEIGEEDYETDGPFPIWHPQDPGSAGVDSAKSTNIKLAEAKLEGHFEPVSGEKVVRAGPFSSAAEAGKVRLVKGGWNEGFIDECLSFPKGTFKDQVDAASDAYNKILDMVGKKRKSKIQ